MVAISELLQSCLRQFLLLINSGTLANHTGEVPLQEWRDELGRLRVWAANIGAHQTRQSSLDYRLRDASHIKSQIVRLLEQFQELLTDLQDVLEESSDDEAQDHQFKDLGGSESENSTTEVQEIHQTLVETIDQLYQMSMIIRKPAQHDRLVGTKKLDSEPFQFWAKQHSSTRYPNADALAIDRISSAMARQRAILKYRERHHAKLSQDIVSESDNKSTLLSETVATDVFKEIPGQLSDMASDAGISETSYGGTLLEGTGADTPKIPPIPKRGTGKRPFECPYCFYIITVRDRKAWARHIFRDLMPYVCIFPGCSTPNKLYGGRRQWHHHIQQAHASMPSTNGTYDCSICKQGSLPAVGFQRHVGQHLEELALFLLPRTDEYEDENEEGTDENLSNVSLDDNSVESVEQRHDTNDAATPASDSSEDETSEWLRKSQQFERMHQEISDDIQTVREAEEKRKKEDALKDAVEEWKLEQDRIKQRQAEEAIQKAKEFRDHLRNIGSSEEEIDRIINNKKAEKKQNEKQNEELGEQLRTSGYSEAVIEHILPGKRKKQKEGKHKEPKVEEPKTTWIKCHHTYLLPETLMAYDLPWDWDEKDPNYIIIKKWIVDDLQDEIFDHTRRLRERKVLAQTSSSLTDFTEWPLPPSLSGHL
ncbi:hypothetical protein ACN38_g11829 [Penicillium nordicum]|uniref:Oxidoreductase acuF-like C2H2 type zinc-finger domain-containing protein n=1 Tax=Penicillium nordicum TaxID=229535 RepID=A0A0M8NY51_9EURO|nr:hypothetical protein ACN38_g11829 [Penicillium nordicum]